MTTLHFHLQPQYKHELFHIYFTSVIYPLDSVIHLAFEQLEPDLQRITLNEQRVSLALSAIWFV